MRQIYSGKSEDAPDIDWDDPFFAASKAPRIGKPPGGVEDHTDAEERAEVRRMLEEIDQT